MINPIRGLFQAAALEGSLLRKMCRAIKGPRHFQTTGGDHFSGFFLSAWMISKLFFLSSKHKKHTKTHQSLLILFSSPEIQGIVLIPNLLLLGSTSWI